MEPIFSLPYSEFCVAEQLAKLLPASQGYSFYIPVSRQQPGVDLVVARRRKDRMCIACIQVKSSRTYSRPTITSRTKRPLRYKTWFNNFDCPLQADFFCLVAIYPAIDSAQRREMGSWWAPQILLFSQTEMRSFLRGVRTVGGKKDRMFGFGFNVPEEAVQARGDSKRWFRDFSQHLLRHRVDRLRRFRSIPRNLAS